ncbi:MAG: hypothetical protein QMD05_06630 [Candidatus Brocadiaceae bacterium]|nr:hypothetical protein [Candidatus Brocadiaceae bacterium]
MDTTKNLQIAIEEALKDFRICDEDGECVEKSKIISMLIETIDIWYYPRD